MISPAADLARESSPQHSRLGNPFARSSVGSLSSVCWMSATSLRPSGCRGWEEEEDHVGWRSSDLCELNNGLNCRAKETLKSKIQQLTCNSVLFSLHGPEVGGQPKSSRAHCCVSYEGLLLSAFLLLLRVPSSPAAGKLAHPVLQAYRNGKGECSPDTHHFSHPIGWNLVTRPRLLQRVLGNVVSRHTAMCSAKTG